MDTTIGQNTAQNIDSPTHAWSQRIPWLWIAIVAAAALIVGIGMWLLLRPDTPSDSSAEAGFARDMSIHHAQAVEMALIAKERTEDPAIQTLATDIILTQQAQIGQMRGWLDAWGLPPNGSQPQMAWMGHAVDGRMPGMAGPEDIDRLRQMPAAEMDELFLDLMIVHHRAGVGMANAILDRSDESPVRFLAQAMATSQKYEIDVMQDLLETKGFDRVPDEEMSMPGMDMDDHEHQ